MSQHKIYSSSLSIHRWKHHHTESHWLKTVSRWQTATSSNLFISGKEDEIARGELIHKLRPITSGIKLRVCYSWVVWESQQSSLKNGKRIFLYHSDLIQTPYYLQKTAPTAWHQVLNWYTAQKLSNSPKIRHAALRLEHEDQNSNSEKQLNYRSAMNPHPQSQLVSSVTVHNSKAPPLSNLGHSLDKQILLSWHHLHSQGYLWNYQEFSSKGFKAKLGSAKPMYPHYIVGSSKPGQLIAQSSLATLKSQTGVEAFNKTQF